MRNKNTNKDRHNTAGTSIESFKILNNSGQRLKEKIKVLEVIKNNQPVTSRMVSLLTGIERTNITRSLFDLVHEQKPKIKEAYTARCFVTKRRVKYYSLIDWPSSTLFH